MLGLPASEAASFQNYISHRPAGWVPRRGDATQDEGRMRPSWLLRTLVLEPTGKADADVGGRRLGDSECQT